MNDPLLNVTNLRTEPMQNFSDFLGDDDAAAAPDETTRELYIGVPSIVAISVLFWLIGVVGIIGNALVIAIIVGDKKMRHSVTNMFIMNLAVSDLLIMLFGVPEIVQFIVNRGWLLGEVMCKFNRYVLVLSLYASVITLLSVCIERYIAIIHPMKAHIVCSNRRMKFAIALIWTAVFILALPIPIFNRTVSPPVPPGVRAPKLCRLQFPGNDRGGRLLIAHKYVESVLFYVLPILTQIVCYTIIGKSLFASTGQLRRSESKAPRAAGVRTVNSQRRGVVKMLIASVAVYVVSYSPPQALLVYRTFASAPPHRTWLFLVAVTAMAYLNSAANPLLYCIFNHKFRAKFAAIFCYWRRRRTPIDQNGVRRNGFHSAMTTTKQGYVNSLNSYSNDSTVNTKCTQLLMKAKVETIDV